MKNILDISDWDLQYITMQELNLMDSEILSIRRDKISTTLFWEGYCRKGFVTVLPNTIVMSVEGAGKVFYIGKKSFEYLLERGYCLGLGFVYDRVGVCVEELDG